MYLNYILLLYIVLFVNYLLLYYLDSNNLINKNLFKILVFCFNYNRLDKNNIVKKFVLKEI